MPSFPIHVEGPVQASGRWLPRPEGLSLTVFAASSAVLLPFQVTNSPFGNLTLNSFPTG